MAKTDKKPLASALIKEAKSVLEYVEKADVSALAAWLLNNKELPLICVGSGGKRTSYASLLYEIVANVARTVTPLEFAAMSPAVIKKSKILLLSTSGSNMDIKHAADIALEHNMENTACITFKDDAKNEVMKKMEGRNCFLFKNSFSDNFISIRGKFLLYGLLYKAFSGKDRFADMLCYEGKYKYEINESGELPQLSQIQSLCVLYGSYGEPVARDIESIMTEGGVASTTICDYRNYCHGRFIYAGNHCQSRKVEQTTACMVLLVSPREKKLAEGVRKIALAKNMPVVVVETELDNALASIQLLFDALYFAFDFAEKHHGINPNDPFNYSGIDKRAPIRKVNYVSSLKKMGEISI